MKFAVYDTKYEEYILYGGKVVDRYSLFFPCIDPQYITVPCGKWGRVRLQFEAGEKLRMVSDLQPAFFALFKEDKRKFRIIPFDGPMKKVGVENGRKLFEQMLIYELGEKVALGL
tara:strand:+ start:5978 stop:6322 length:345 start_codon:yes stop_codon:yes gene_type:complete